MPAYGVEIPYPEPYDVAQEQRDRQLEAIQTSLDWGAIRLQVLERLALDMMSGDGPIGALVQQLADVPIRDTYDLSGYIKFCGPRDGQRIGVALMRIVAEECLKAVEAADVMF